MDASERRDEMRPITALFADIVGSTGLGERLAPDEVRRVEARASSRISHCFAVLAYEDGELREAARFLWRSFREAPHRRLVRPGTWLLAAACVCRWLLPAGVHRSLEAWATRLRVRRTPPAGADDGA